MPISSSSWRFFSSLYGQAVLGLALAGPQYRNCQVSVAIRSDLCKNITMLRLLILLVAISALAAQDVRDIMNAKLSANTASTTAVTVTATQGDGASCRIAKVSSGVITAQISCVAADGKTSMNSTVLRSNGTVATPLMVDFGDVAGLVAVNPTTTAAVMGSLGSVPANGIAWQFTTNIRTAGSVTGQTALVSGSVTWP